MKLITGMGIGIHGYLFTSKHISMISQVPVSTIKLIIGFLGAAGDVNPLVSGQILRLISYLILLFIGHIGL